MITFIFVIICFAVYLAQIMGLISYQDYGLSPLLVKYGQIYRMITGAFLHANIQHILANMFSFLNLGLYCENFANKKKYLLALIVSLFTSALSVYLLSNEYTYTVGFSGVVFGVLGFYAVCLYKNDGKLDANEKNYLFRVIASNIIVSLMPGVSWQGHLGGFIGGFITALLVL